MKKIKTKKRNQRAIDIGVDFGKEHQVLTRMNLDEMGVLTFYGEHNEVLLPVRIEVGAAYPRDKKRPKVLNRLISDPHIIQIDSNRQLSRFAFLFAVDTNTKRVGNTFVSVAACHYLRDIEFQKDSWSVKLIPQDAFEFHDATIASERIGWIEAIKRIVSFPTINGEIGLIVDSSMSELRDINARKVPLLGNIYLPDGVELLYGCGDRGTEEYIANAAIAKCDMIARRVLMRIGQESNLTYSSAENGLYIKYRYWRTRDFMR